MSFNCNSSQPSPKINCEHDVLSIISLPTLLVAKIPHHALNLLLFSSRDENKENFPDKAIVLEENQAEFQDTQTPCDGTLRVGMGNLKSRKPTSISKTENGKNREESQVIKKQSSPVFTVLFPFCFNCSLVEKIYYSMKG